MLMLPVPAGPRIHDGRLTVQFRTSITGDLEPQPPCGEVFPRFGVGKDGLQRQTFIKSAPTEHHRPQ